MKHKLLSLLPVIAGLVAAAPAAAAVRILEVNPTVLFTNETPLRQVAWVEVGNDAGAPVALQAHVLVDGRPAGAAQALTVEPGHSRQEVLVPDLAAAATVEIRLMQDGRQVASVAQPWRPQRKWKVFLVKSSHQDIGYEDFLFTKETEIADHIDMARRISGPPDLPPDSPRQAPPGYHYYLESLLFPRYYINERSPAAWRRLVEEKIRPGSMGLGGAPSGVHTHWMDYEELVRTTYPARREFADRWGLDLDTYLIVDNPSMSWSTAQVLAKAGFRYAVRFGQIWRTGGNNDYATTGVPAVFWWRGPDRTSRILYGWRARYSHNFWFGEAVSHYSSLLDLAAINVNREILAVQEDGDLGPYPWDALMVPTYRDHTTPAWENAAFRNWREKYRYPEMRIGDPRDFMSYMERKYGEELPELSGDLNNFSADYSTIDPESQGWKRRAARVLPFAEGVNVLARKLDPGLPPRGDLVAETYRRMHDFDEHSWPTTPRPLEFHQFNPQWGKRREGRRALEVSDGLLRHGLGALTARIAAGDQPLLAVFNPLAHGRSDVVVAPGTFHRVTDVATGASLPAQPAGDGTSVFLARDVPAFGYRGYRIDPAAPAVPPATDLAAGATTLANAHYELVFDPRTGAVTSLRDRDLQRELVDPRAPYAFNQLVYVEKDGRESLEGTDYAPAPGARLTATRGPVFAEMVAEMHDPRLGGAKIRQAVRLYAGLRRFDVVNRLDHFGALHSEYPERYRKNVFYAFPVAIDGFTARAEYAGGVVRPHDDQLRWGTHDYLHANRWVDVSNADHGFTMMPWNAATIHFGEIRYNRFSVDYKPSSSHLYSYAWSNRMAGLRELVPSDWNATLGYSFAAHRGDWTGATGPGWSVASPLEARLVPAGTRGPLPAAGLSMLSLDAPNVQLVVLKESEQPGRGAVVRLVETDGRDTEVTLDASWLGLDAAVLCDLVENDLQPLAVGNGRVTLRIGAHAYATVRLHAREPVPAVPGRVTVTADSDSSVSLAWTPVAGAEAYNVYRATDPEEPPTLHTLVGRTTVTSHVDRGLDIGGTYHYRVAAVTARNTQGEPSARSTVRTLLGNTTPPSPVRELGVVRLDPERLMVCWSKSPESDVSRYFVHRSRRADFPPDGTELVAEVSPGGHSLEHHIDTGLTPGVTYHYRVFAEDWAGHRQSSSPTAAGTTPLRE